MTHSQTKQKEKSFFLTSENPPYVLCRYLARSAKYHIHSRNNKGPGREKYNVSQCVPLNT